MSSMNGRITRLEHYLKPAACRVCYGKPSRVVTIDPVTDEQLSESLPADGCPECGTAVFREYRVVADESRGA